MGVCAFNTGGPGIAIGIPYSDAAGTDRGEVYCYKRTGNTWSFIQNIIPADLGNSDNYGASISMDTDYVAVGAPYQDNATYSLTDAGAAYVYAFGGGVWNFQQKLVGYTASAQFGLSLGLYSNMLAVGAPWATAYSNTSAGVYVYAGTGSNWANSTYLYIFNTEVLPYAGQIQPVTGITSISTANLTFGMSVSLSGNTLLIGAPGGIQYASGSSSYDSYRAGSVYIYNNSSGSFIKTGVVNASLSVTGNFFGQSVGISGTNYMLGSPKETVNGLVNAGTVYFGSVSD